MLNHLNVVEVLGANDSVKLVCGKVRVDERFVHLRSLLLRATHTATPTPCGISSWQSEHGSQHFPGGSAAPLGWQDLSGSRSSTGCGSTTSAASQTNEDEFIPLQASYESPEAISSRRRLPWLAISPPFSADSLSYALP